MANKIQFMHDPIFRGDRNPLHLDKEKGEKKKSKDSK